MAVLTREEFERWREDAITKKLMQIIQRDIDNMKNMLVGADLEDVKELQGRCRACDNLVKIEYEDLYE